MKVPYLVIVGLISLVVISGDSFDEGSIMRPIIYFYLTFCKIYLSIWLVIISFKNK